MSPATREPAGDLTITVHVEPHPYFKRDGRNLQVEVPVTVAEAILGAKIDVADARRHEVAHDPAGKLERAQAAAQGTRNPRFRRQARAAICSSCSRSSCPRQLMPPAGG